MIIREMVPQDWDSVFEIYKQGIDCGIATFTTEYPTYEQWDVSHHKACRYVALCNEQIAGFVTISPTSPRAPYIGVAEVSVYVHHNHRNKGVATALLGKLIDQAPKNGFWSLYSAILATNSYSIKLHNKCGFRTIGYRQRIAKDRFGNWTDTVVMEYRLPDELVKDN